MGQVDLVYLLFLPESYRFLSSLCGLPMHAASLTAVSSAASAQAKRSIYSSEFSSSALFVLISGLPAPIMKDIDDLDSS